MVSFHAGLDKLKDNALALGQPTPAAFNVALDISNQEQAAIVSIHHVTLAMSVVVRHLPFDPDTTQVPLKTFNLCTNIPIILSLCP